MILVFQAMAMSNNMLNSKTFLKNHKPLIFINVILMDLMQNKFPGLYCLQSLFELILVRLVNISMQKIGNAFLVFAINLFYF